MKLVPLGPALAVIHDRLVCSDADYREFLNTICNADVPMWDVVRAHKAADTILRNQHPALIKYPPPEKTDNGTASRYVRAVATQMGKDRIRVRPMDRGRFKVRTASAAIRAL